MKHLVTIFYSFLVKFWTIMDMQWNERTKYLASSSEDDGWIKVMSLIVPNHLPNKRENSPLSLLCLFWKIPPCIDLVDGQRSARPHFASPFRMWRIGLASEREIKQRRRN